MNQLSSLHLRYMRIADVPEVTRIDEVSFFPPWPERSYRFEINESNVSYMVVLQRNAKRRSNGFRRLWHIVRSNGKVPVQTRSYVAGYGGLWKIAEEAHISTIAVHPDDRGKKYGEIVLAGMLRRAICLGAEYVVLEVRVSNEVAQKLYFKYDFTIHGVKTNYYQQNNEDAYDMRLDLTPENIEAFKVRYDTLVARIPFTDDYSYTQHPRLKR